MEESDVSGITITHLWNAAKVLNSNNSTHILLKSYYLNKIHSLAEENGYLKLTKTVIKKSNFCRKCGVLWCEGNFDMKIICKKTRRKSKKKSTLLVMVCKLCKTKTKSLIEKSNKNKQNKHKEMNKGNFVKNKDKDRKTPITNIKEKPKKILTLQQLEKNNEKKKKNKQKAKSSTQMGSQLNVKKGSSKNQKPNNMIALAKLLSQNSCKKLNSNEKFKKMLK